MEATAPVLVAPTRIIPRKSIVDDGIDIPLESWVLVLEVSSWPTLWYWFLRGRQTKSDAKW
jgi:hypothetical protein